MSMCGLHLMITHAVGCPRAYTEWTYATGREMPPENVSKLWELTKAIEDYLAKKEGVGV